MVDWRGTPITEGALVIYGAPVGRSIQMVEATVDGFTPSGRVWLKVVRRSFTGSYTDRVHVGADRLTIVTQLPPTALETAAEQIVRRERERVERERRWATHDIVTEPGPETWSRGTPRCTRCGASGWAEPGRADCLGAGA